MMSKLWENTEALLGAPAWRRAAELTTLGAVVLLAGCGEAKPTRATIQGSITFQGKPVPAGEIVFVPIDERQKRFYAQGPIVEGKYNFAERGPVVGKNRVEIHGYKKTGRKRANIAGKSLTEEVEMVEETIPYIPPQFNEVSELTWDVKPGANPDANFDLREE